MLLPGLDGTEIFFRPLLAALPQWVKPVVVTYPVSGTNRYSELLGVVQEAVDQAEECYVLGWSFSGPLALRLAAKEPTKVRGVILCATFIRPPLPGLSRLRFAVTTPAIYSMRLAHRATMWFSSHSTTELRRDKWATWARVPSHVLAARAREILALDARDCLRACAHRVLYVAGSNDRIVPSRNAAEIVRELASTKVVTIDGPHLALYTNPSAAVHAIIGFMRESA